MLATSPSITSPPGTVRRSWYLRYVATAFRLMSLARTMSAPARFAPRSLPPQPLKREIVVSLSKRQPQFSPNSCDHPCWSLCENTLPNYYWGPTFRPQLGPVLRVATLVPLKLRRPIILVGFGEVGAAIGATVPEASIYKYRYSLLREGKVRRAWDSMVIGDVSCDTS